MTILSGVVTAAPYLVLAAVGAPVLAGLATMLLPASRRLTRLALATAGPATSVLLMAIHLGRNGVSTADTPTGTIAWVPSLNLDISFLVDGLGAFFALLIAAENPAPLFFRYSFITAFIHRFIGSLY